VAIINKNLTVTFIERMLFVVTHIYQSVCFPVPLGRLPAFPRYPAGFHGI